LIKYSLPTAV